MQNKISLYEISQEFKNIFDLANDEQFDENGVLIDNSKELTELFEEVQGTLSDKLDNTMHVVRSLEFANSSTQGEIDYLVKLVDEKKQKVKYKENKISFLKDLMSNAVRASGDDKIETDKFKFNRYVKKNTSVSIANEDELPREWVKLERKPKKKEILSALKSGQEIAGCSLNDSVVFTCKG